MTDDPMLAAAHSTEPSGHQSGDITQANPEPLLDEAVEGDGVPNPPRLEAMAMFSVWTEAT